MPDYACLTKPAVTGKAAQHLGRSVAPNKLRVQERGGGVKTIRGHRWSREWPCRMEATVRGTAAGRQTVNCAAWHLHVNPRAASLAALTLSFVIGCDCISNSSGLSGVSYTNCV